MRWESLSEVWCADCEFQPEGRQDGGRPVPICLVAQETRSGRMIRLWRDELLRLRRPPFDIGPHSALCAYMASAELGCFLSLGWPLPHRVIDLYVECRVKNNNGPLNQRRSLLDVMRDNGLPFMSEVHKEAMRNLILERDDWSVQERHAILDYCQEDVAATAMLLRRIERHIDLPRALLRGRYSGPACARIERIATPLDVELWHRLIAARTPLLQRLIDKEDRPYGVYAGTTSWSHKRFDQLLRRRGYAWPRTAGTGRPVLEKETFKRMCEIYPSLEGLRQLRKTIRWLMEPDLRIGPDGRNRVLTSPFGSVTGRNTPKLGRFIFGAARWLRGLIRPEPGFSLSYIDWTAQEIAVAAALSGDERLRAAYLSGDPYLAFAISAGLAPERATKETHARMREVCKVVFLATFYGQTAIGLAARLRVSQFEAIDLLQMHRDTYRSYWRWSERTTERADLDCRIRTKLGWGMRVTDGDTLNTLMNWQMQAHGAELMRLAAIEMTETGIRVNTPVHDAFLIEGPTHAIGEINEMAREAMHKAGGALLGIPIRTEVKSFDHPDRYVDDKDGAPQMWGQVIDWLGEVEAASRPTQVEVGEHGHIR